MNQQQRRNTLVFAVILFFLALLCIIAASQPYVPDPNATVTCNNQQMSRDEVCVHYFANEPPPTSTFGGSSYDEQAQYQENMRKLEHDKASNEWGTGAFLLGILGLVALISGLRTPSKPSF